MLVSLYVYVFLCLSVISAITYQPLLFLWDMHRLVPTTLAPVYFAYFFTYGGGPTFIKATTERRLSNWGLARVFTPRNIEEASCVYPPPALTRDTSRVRTNNYSGGHIHIWGWEGGNPMNGCGPFKLPELSYPLHSSWRLRRDAFLDAHFLRPTSPYLNSHLLAYLHDWP